MIEIIASVCFCIAVVHTFSVRHLNLLAARFRPGSVAENFFHLIGEVEVIFGLWAGIFLALMALTESSDAAVAYLEARNFTEPFFVFVVMTICSTKPILELASSLLSLISGLLPGRKSIAFYITTLIVGPLLGSFITEPAAMTVTAMILFERFFRSETSMAFKYATLGLLFVNISIGGTLTPYAAPPILMVASKWNWDLTFMINNFGLPTTLSLLVSTFATAWFFRHELAKISGQRPAQPGDMPVPMWVGGVHLFALSLVIAYAHHMVIFVAVFMFFLGLVKVTSEYQSELKLREALLVAFFLGGLVVLGASQRWWLEPIMGRLSEYQLFFSTTALTAILDNAALTYLGSQVPSLSEVSKFALGAGAVVGGGLTVIANAPNPIGYGILNSSFGEAGISPLKLLCYAAPPTAVALLFFFIKISFYQ